MSLIIYQPKTLKDVAIISLEISSEEKIKTEHLGDLTIIKSNNKIVGANLLNASKHLELKEGAHVISDKQIKVLEKLGLKNVEYKNHFSIGKVISRKEHPKSKKLFVLEVETNQKLNIVTNSKNSLEGTLVVVANVGATLPTGMKIILSKVMGIESQGMLCGESTLGLGKKSEGVLLLKKGQPGENFIF